MNIRFFEENKDKALFKVYTQFMEHSFSGILVVKKINSEEIRMVMTMETGIKVYDVSIFPKKSKLNDGMPIFKNAFVKKVLLKDLQLLLHHPFETSASSNEAIIFKEGKYWFTENALQDSTFKKIRINKKHSIKETALKTINERLIIQESQHLFSTAPYKSTYKRIEQINP